MEELKKQTGRCHPLLAGRKGREEEEVTLQPRAQGPGLVGTTAALSSRSWRPGREAPTSQRAAWADSEGRNSLASLSLYLFIFQQCLLSAKPRQKPVPRGGSETQPAALAPSLLSGPEPGQAEEMREGQTGQDGPGGISSFCQVNPSGWPLTDKAKPLGP